MIFPVFHRFFFFLSLQSVIQHIGQSCQGREYFQESHISHFLSFLQRSFIQLSEIHQRPGEWEKHWHRYHFLSLFHYLHYKEIFLKTFSKILRTGAAPIRIQWTLRLFLESKVSAGEASGERVWMARIHSVPYSHFLSFKIFIHRLQPQRRNQPGEREKHCHRYPSFLCLSTFIIGNYFLKPFQKSCESFLRFMSQVIAQGHGCTKFKYAHRKPPFFQKSKRPRPGEAPGESISVRALLMPRRLRP